MWCKKILALCLVLVMCIPAFSGMNVSAEKTNKKEVTTIMELPDLENWHYRIPIIVDTGDYNRTDCVLSQTINITREIGGFGTFDNDSVRVIETTENATPQYEAVSQYRWINKDNLDVTWLMNGTTPANTKRYYSIYFDTLENGAKNATTYPEYLTTKENSQHIWVYGNDYEIRIDKKRGGSRVVKIEDVPRKGYSLDKDWMSWYTQHINWNIKGANTTLTEDGPIYKTVKIVSSDNSQTLYWYFYPDKMRIVTEEEYDSVSFDTIADNLNNKKGILVWGDGTTENLTEDYSEYSKNTDFFYILDPELNSANDDVKGISGFWADTIDGRNQTIINAGEKGTRWVLDGNEAWFGFEKNDVIRDVVLRSQNPPEVTREYSWIILESPIIEDEKVFENQVVVIKGDLTVTNTGTLLSVGSSLIVHGNITIEENGELYIVSSRELLPPKPPELPPWPPLPPRPPIRPPIRSVTVAGNISVNGNLFIAKDSLNMCGENMCGENDGMNGIHVNSIGTLESYDATITAFSGEIPVSITNQKIGYEKSYYNFDIYGEAQIDSSKISYLYDGVRILNGSDVSIQNSHISDSAGNGIFIDENCTPIIKDNTITNCGNAGIFIDPPMSNEDESQNTDNPSTQDNSTNSSDVVEAVNITYYDGYMEILFSDGSTMIVPYQPVEHNSTNFILNGDFSDGLNHWTKWGGSRYGSWSDEVVSDSGNYPHVLEYQVWNSRADGSSTGVYQSLNIDVTKYSSIYLECEVKVISNSLTDSGWWSNKYGGNGEMPGHIWIYYKDSNDENWVWSQGFLPNADRFNRRNIDMVVRNQWYSYQSTNLVNEDTTITNPYNQVITGHKMKTITGIYVGGNGWDFKGRFDCVNLWGEEVSVNQPPVATVDTYQKTGEVTKDVGFKGTGSDSDGSIVKYEWDFDGNGVYDWSSSTSASTTHAYNAVGTYFPVLRVTDNDGATDTDYLRVNVWDPDAWTLEGNTITGCDYGILIMGAYVYYENQQHYAGDCANILNCTIYDNDYGVYFYRAIPTIIKDSYIFYNTYYDIILVNSTPTIIGSSYNRMHVWCGYFDGGVYANETDSDGDNWYDWQELYVYGFNPYMEDPDKENLGADFDDDGITNVDEGGVYGTDPLNPDTDLDGLNDWDEIETHYTNALNPDTDFDGSYDGIELNFAEKTGTDPLVHQTLLVVKLTEINLAQDYLPPSSSYGEFKIYGNDIFLKYADYYTNPVAEDLIVALIYPYNGETATFGFKVEKRDWSGYQIFGYWVWWWTGTWTTICDTIVSISPGTTTITGNNNDEFAFSAQEIKANSNEPPWAPLAKELAPILIYEDLNQEFPTSIFFDGDRDMSNNGVPNTEPGKTTQRTFTGDYAYLNTYRGTGYYDSSHDLNWKKSKTCVYMNVLKDGNLLGIQYWFYYPFHDDPGGQVYMHDWWYFWIVYDMSQHKPTRAVYDFHHNLRAYDWDHPRIHKEGFHPKVWIDAGGHRSLFASGGDISAGVAMVLKDNTLYSMFETTQTLTATYDVVDSTVWFTVSTNGRGSVTGTDEMFGAMIKYLYHEGSYSGDGYGENIAEWRYTSTTDKVSVKWYDLIGGTINVGTAVGNYDSGTQLNVEDFSHWVYVYDVDYTEYDDTISGQKYVEVGYTGDNMYYQNDNNRWPSTYPLGDTSTHLPWMVGGTDWGRTSSASGQTVRQAWEWKISPTTSMSPTTTTIYFDGSVS